MKSIPLSICAVALAAATAVAAPAGRTSPPPAATAVLEVTETSAGGAASTTRFETAITLDHGTAKLAASAGDIRYDVSTAWTSAGGARLIDLSFEQHRERKPPTQLALRASVKRGQRTTLANLTRPDGSRLTVAITLR